LESFIRNGFINKQHVVSVFFDLEKAYDTTWKHGILSDLHDLGFRGRMPHFIDSFLQSREFKVRVGSTLSNSVDQEMGVPQGAILSVTLFSIKINNLAKVLNENIDGSLFVDDFSISCRGSNMSTVERQLQLCLNKINKWSLENGFRFSKAKTNVLHFCNKRKLHNDPELLLDRIPLNVVKEAKFLGLIFDNKLSFIPHIKHLKTKCLKALNLLKAVSGTKWGGDQKTLLTLYRALIRSKLDYGSVIYGSARKSYLKQLDTIHHQGLRLALGAFRTSPVSSLYVEADEPSLSERQIKLSLQYITKLKSNPSNPAYNCVFHPEYITLYEHKPSAIAPLGIRMKEHIVDAHINISNIKSNKLLNFPPWQMVKPTVNLDLTKFTKSTTNQLIYQQYFAELKSSYPDHVTIYTDGSKDGVSVTAAAIVNSQPLTCRLPDDISIFSAEAKAIQIALEAIKGLKAGPYILFSDSLSCLQAIQNYCDNTFIIEILQLHDYLATSQYEVVFCWLPSHVGLRGNDLADAAAKSAHSSSITPMPIPYSDSKHNINLYIKSLRQTKWDLEVHNKLHHFQPVIGFTPSSGVYCRQDETVLRRCRIGHTFYTHSYVLKGEDRPRCVGCDEDLTVKHVLLDCVDFATQRAKFYSSPSLKHLFTQVPGHLILSYLKEIQLYEKF
jgi:ribonuclease HI